MIIAKKNNTNNPHFISPLMDLDKKDKDKLKMGASSSSTNSTKKFKLILKKDNKAQIKEIDKNWIIFIIYKFNFIWKL